MYVPFTGLGLYGGFRGNRWLKNRIQVFKQFVIPSLKNQTSQNFKLWISWRHQEKNNPIVQDLMLWLDLHAGFPVVHTFSGVCFYDDKYDDEMAQNRLVSAIHGSLMDLTDHIGDCEHVLMTIQPSDDLYYSQAVEGIQKLFDSHPELQAVGFTKGYISNYSTKETAEYNPNTNPPFYTIKFPKATFMDPRGHANYTGLKADVYKDDEKLLYKKGTPLPSHEYVPICLNYGKIEDVRGFLVGTHGENISTTFVHPFKGTSVSSEVLKNFGIYEAPYLKIKFSWRKKLLRKLPHKVQRKLRYIFGERGWNRIYNFLRS